MLVHIWCAPTWRFHTGLCKFLRNISTNICGLGERTDLKLGEESSLSIFNRITISWLNPLNGFRFIFLLRDSENDLHEAKSLFQYFESSTFQGHYFKVWTALEKIWRFYNTRKFCPQHYVIRTFWPRDSKTIFESKIVQFSGTMKSPIFIKHGSNFEIVSLKCWTFKILKKWFRFIYTLKPELRGSEE